MKGLTQGLTKALKFNYHSNSSPSGPKDPNMAERALKGLINQPVNLFNMMMETKEVCYICETNFTLIQKKNVCMSCGRLVCKDHSVSTGSDDDRLCESCHHEKLVEETDSKSQAIKQEIAQEIQACNQEREEKTKQLTKFIAKVRKLENKQKDQNATFERKEWEVEMQFQKESEENYKIEEEIKELKLQLEANQSIEERTLQKTARSHEELEITRLKIEKMNKERKKYEKELKEIAELSKTQVSTQTIKENVCQVCMQNMRKEFSKYFRPAPQTENKIKKGPSKKFEDMRRDICACYIF